MDAFPNYFTPKGINQQRQYKIDEQLSVLIAQLHEFLNNCTEKNKEYQFNFKDYNNNSVEFSNAIIKVLRNSAPQDTTAITRYWSYFDGINGKMTQLKFWFADPEYYQQTVKRNEDSIRKQIVDKIKSMDGPEFKFALFGPNFTKSFDKIIEELEERGWKVEVQRKSGSNSPFVADDDYSFMEINMTDESDSVIVNYE
jgi:hypothetical protein